jgi:hypothetical protein
MITVTDGEAEIVHLSALQAEEELAGALALLDELIRDPA